MAQRTYNQNALKVGAWDCDCDRCGFTYKNFDLKKEWTDLMVCRDCYEPRHPQDFIRGVPDDPSVPWTRPTSIPDTIDYHGDEGATLTSISLGIHDWNEEMDEDRVVILDIVSPQKGDRFIIYKTTDEDNKLILTSKTLDSGQTV